MTPRHEAASRRTGEPTRILCVDDNLDITTAMKMVIETDPTLEYIGCLASADGLIDKIRGMSKPPHVVLLDATMPGACPIEAMREMAYELPAIRTIMFSGHGDPAFIDRVRSAGAWGYVSKNDDPHAILRAVHEVAGGNAWWPPSGRNV